jgi:hypothetical protein
LASAAIGNQAAAMNTERIHRPDNVALLAALARLDDNVALLAALARLDDNVALLAALARLDIIF